MPRPLLFVLVAAALWLHAPAIALAQEEKPRLDRFGDPLPPGVLARLGTVRFNRCRCATYSPDGKIIVTGDREGAYVWDAATGKKLRDLPAEGDRRVVGLVFSHDGRKLAQIGWDAKSITLWETGTFKKTVLNQAGDAAEGDWSRSAAFSKDDKTLFSATSSKLFHWDVASGKKLKEIPLRHNVKVVDVRLVVFSQDGQLAATEGDSGAHIWETKMGAMLHEIKDPEPILRTADSMAFSRDAKTLVIGGWFKHEATVWSVETGKKMHDFPVEQVHSVAFATDGKTLALTRNDGKGLTSLDGDGERFVQLWDYSNLKAPPRQYKAPGIDFVTFSPDGKTLTWSCCEQTLCFMDRETGKDLRPIPSHRGAINSLVYFPDGRRVASASDDGTLRIWDAMTGESLHVLRGHVGAVSGLALSPNGKALVSCGKDGTVRFWDAERVNNFATLSDQKHWLDSATFSADGKRLATCGLSGPVVLRDPATGKPLDQLGLDLPAGVAISPNGKTLAIKERFSDSDLRLYDIETKALKSIPLKAIGSSVAYSPNGKILAVNCNQNLLLLDAAKHHVLKTLPGHGNRLGGLAFSADGRYLASVSRGWGEADRNMRVFELASLTEIFVFKKELPIYAAAFSPDGSRLAVGGADATAVILDMNNLSGKKRRETLIDADFSAHWESLAAADAGQAYEARADLLHAAKSTLAFFGKRLEPAPAVDAKTAAGWIKDLDSDRFRVRDEATKSLEKQGELVRAFLRKALAADPSAETKQRLQGLLDKLDGMTPPQLRSLRAIEILERIGTPDALAIVERLAQGNPDGLATVESRTVAARMSRRLSK